MRLLHPPQAQAPLLTPAVLICSVGTEILVLAREDEAPAAQAAGEPAAGQAGAAEAAGQEGGGGGGANHVAAASAAAEPGLDLSGLGALRFAGWDGAGRPYRLAYRADASWQAHLDGEGWDRERAVMAAAAFPQLKLQVGAPPS